MTKEEFELYSQKKIIYLDGATGTNLVREGMPAGVCPEAWICSNRDIMLKLQKEYVSAGTDILYAPTFTANRIKLSEYGLADRLEEMVHTLVGISKEAAGEAADRRVYGIGNSH